MTRAEYRSLHWPFEPIRCRCGGRICAQSGTIFGTYLCRGCSRFMPWCFGAADDMPNHCDDCWRTADLELREVLCMVLDRNQSKALDNDEDRRALESDLAYQMRYFVNKKGS